MILLGSIQRIELIKLIERHVGRERRLQVAAKWQKEAQERSEKLRESLKKLHNEDDMIGRAHKTWGRLEMHIKFWLRCLMQGGWVGDLDKPWTVMLKCILKKHELHWIHLYQNKFPLFHTEFLWTLQ